ncbi:MAG: phosphotransferase family protein [SAR324 cluster bacterium]|nr:phosphotransferase family protein [SAR324 cluster bacterium]MBL7035870.1 phosphotransferase family protein [SAR324 cluster bacterium]
MKVENSKRIEALTFWQKPICFEPLEGGITNQNFRVEHGVDTFFVRLGEDIPEHGVYRFNELAASRAAFACGISPEVVHEESGAMVLRFIVGKTLETENLRDHSTMQKVVSLLKKCHLEMPQHLPGSTLIFWVFQVLRGYAKTLRDGKSRMIPELSRFMEINSQLEKTVGAVDLRFGHNDLLAGNFIDDGQRLWLFDWDYAGYNSPLFDLANLASNNEYSENLEQQLLEIYFEVSVSEDLWKRYFAMKCASLLREAMWSMVSEIHSTLDFDYVNYTTENLKRFENTYENYKFL